MIGWQWDPTCCIFTGTGYHRMDLSTCHTLSLMYFHKDVTSRTYCQSCQTTITLLFKDKFLSVYFIYIVPIHRLFMSYQKRFTILTCARPFSVSFLCEKEPPPPRSTPWGAYRCHGSFIHILCSSATTWGNTWCFCICLIAPPTILQSGRSMVVEHVPHVLLWCTSHIDMIAHTPAFLRVRKHS